jgi:D-alanyl-lipoteichoic acid acyltransferase DltB (MBOAT superfamily)
MPEKNPGRFLLYVSFFPQLVAGPIERASKLLPQLNSKLSFAYKNLQSGGAMVLWGFFKKMVVADRLSIYVDGIFNNPGIATSGQLIIATLFFSIQIYCDFSGYTDIAIGCSNFMGVNLSQNFNKPYFAVSIQDFWRRWHITLSNWFRDYLYISLGGNQVSPWRHMRNIFFVFCVCGLWHGANWTFIVWGAIHGILLILNHMLRAIDKHRTVLLLPRSCRIVFVFCLVSIAWIFFRAPSINVAVDILKGIFLNVPNFYEPLANTAISGFEFGLSIFVIFVLILFEACQGNRSLKLCVQAKNRVFRWGWYYFLMFGLLMFGVFGVNEFIYFQF